jgi:peptidoglycan/xylan/chitin deacetylase (PgdA/CDA1 family)
VLTRLRAAYVRTRRQALYKRAAGPGAPLVILRYHAVGEPAAVSRYVHPALALPAARFRDHVRALMRKFRIISPDEVADVISAPRGQRPAVLITFDDGYIDNYELATPILAEERATGAFYVATKPLRPGAWLWTSELWRVIPALPSGEILVPPDHRFTLTPDEGERRAIARRITVVLSAMPEDEREHVLNSLWRKAGRPRGEGLDGTFVTPAQIKAMRAAGMTIGAHTRHHPQLDLLPASLHEPELSGSREDLEEILGEPVRHLAYPNPGGNGTIQPPVRHAAAGCGFKTAVTSVPGPIGPQTDLLRLPRLGIYAGDQEQQLIDTLIRLH